ncbi:MAG TPA: hypothetical protein DDY13_19300 [Cytophagales bacterium]|nr:hypothetical protein [Cytophagales bacterium]
MVVPYKSVQIFSIARKVHIAITSKFKNRQPPFVLDRTITDIRQQKRQNNTLINVLVYLP